MCYKDQMWLSQLSSSDIMWLQEPPTASLLPLDASWLLLKKANKQKYLEVKNLRKKQH